MSRLGKGPRRFRLPWRSREQIRAELEDEIRFHLDERTEELVGEGVDPEEARARALREFGDVEEARGSLIEADEEVERGRRRAERLEGVRRDLRFCLRGLAKSPGFTATGIVTLGVGIGVTTALYSVVSAVLLRPLPFPEPERLVAVSHHYHELSRTQVSPANFRDYRERARSFESLGAFAATSVVVTGPDRPERLTTMLVTEGFFGTLGAPPVLGRALLPADFAPNADATVVISEGVWKRRFGSDPGVLGRSIQLDGSPVTIVGVYRGGLEALVPADVWRPLILSPAWYRDDQRRMAEMLNVLGRLRPAASVSDVQAELNRVAEGLRVRFPDTFSTETGWRISAVPLRDLVVGETRTPLLLLLGAALLVLLISCANVANLLLARAVARRRETAIRRALGGGLGAVARPLLLEAALLGLGGAALGGLLAWGGVRAFVALAPEHLPRVEGARVDGWILAFALGTGLLSALLAAAVPLRRLASTRPATVLGSDGRSASAGPSWRTQRLLVVSATALTFALLVGAGLMSRSLRNLLAVDPGFSTEGVLMAEIDLSAATAPEARDDAAFFDLLVRRLESRAGVSAAGASSVPPLVGFRWEERFSTEEEWSSTPRTDLPRIEIIPVTPGYFTAVGTPLLQGRGFTGRDREGTLPVAVVSRALAEAHWPGRSPLGERLAVNPDVGEAPRWLTVVGVAADVRTVSLAAEPGAVLYEPVAQSPASHGTVFVRSALDPESMAALVREEVRRIDPALPVYDISTMREVVARTTAPRRLAFWVALSFAACSLLLAAVGLYGVVSYLVRSRTRELGVRIALGARSTRILGLVMGQVGGVAALGLVLGLPLALSVAGLLESFLYGVSPVDPATYAVLTVALVGIAALAAYLPARRATRVDPVEALRTD